MVFPTLAFFSVVAVSIASLAAPVVAYYMMASDVFAQHLWTIVAVFSLILGISVTGYLVYARKAYRIFLDQKGRCIIAKPIFFGNSRSAPFSKVDAWIGTRSERRLATIKGNSSVSIDEILTSTTTVGQGLYLSIHEFDRPIVLERRVEPVHKYLLYELARLFGKSVHKQEE